MIRAAVPADTPALVALTAGTGVFKPFEVEVLRDLLHDYHAGSTGSDHVVIVWESQGHLLGYAYYAPDVMTDRTWYIYWIAVAHDRQSQGVGGHLLHHVELDAKARGARLLLIETSSLPHNEPARRFYLKHGYAHVATVPDFYCDGDDMVIFRKRLEGADRS